MLEMPLHHGVSWAAADPAIAHCRCLFSGGWDYAVRIWARQGLTCAGTLAFDDWVWCVAPRGDNLLVSAGVMVHVHDLGTGRQLRRYDNPHGVSVSLSCTVLPRVMCMTWAPVGSCGGMINSAALARNALQGCCSH